jgi:5'-deoxynucleotidase YfbR-like HD superfamily hydrolase
MASRFSDTQLQDARDYLLTLGGLTTQFSTVHRAPRYPDGHRETDVEHSFHLAISAVELARDFYPELDRGLVAQFSLMHDFPEVYAGDVWTFNATEEDLKNKQAEEAKAIERLMTELPPHLAELLRRYEEQEEPEARFVRFVDKILPGIISIIAADASTFKDDHSIESDDHYKQSRKGHLKRIAGMFPEFHDLYDLFELIWDAHSKQMFKETA